MWTPPPTAYFEALVALLALLFLTLVFEARAFSIKKEDVEEMGPRFLRVGYYFNMFTALFIIIGIFAALAGTISPSKPTTFLATIAAGLTMTSLIGEVIAKLSWDYVNYVKPNRIVEGLVLVFFTILISFMALVLSVWAAFQLT